MDRWWFHLSLGTFDEPDPYFFGFDDGVIGIDLNPSGIAWAETNKTGQLIDWGYTGTRGFLSHMA
ncbi:MAG: hypothetical protein GF334_00800 [Candidatus Altiarchaeales archaeon]|nr:hypothetical protein [Candidatus Altiarchaeales archaeon]